jgi:hypothetical protein
MKGDVITLYFPAGDGVRENSNTATYKGIKDFKLNGNGTITFMTTKDGEITTPLYWRLKKNVELKDEEAAPAPGAPVAGNQGRHHW